MKVNNAYIKILRNISLYNSNLVYEGDKIIKVNKDNAIFVEAYVPDFIDVPIYTRSVSEILRLIDDDTNISVDMDDKGYYIIIDNGIGKVKYKMAKKSIVEKFVNNNRDIDEMFSRCERNIVKFNLSKEKYEELMKVSKMLDTNILQITSENDNVIKLTTYTREYKDDKQYTIDVEVNHVHFDESLRFQLNCVDYVQASDYNIEIGLKNTKTNSATLPLIKATAFMDDKIKVKYLTVGEKL